MKKYLWVFIIILIPALFLGFNYYSESGISGEEQSLDVSECEATTYGEVNNIDGVTMAVKEGTVSSGGLIAAFDNQSDRECIYGEDFTLEKKINGEWYRASVTIEEDYGFEDIGYQLDPDGDSEWTADWQWLYGNLEPGQYRIVKSLLVANDGDGYDRYYLAADFAIE